MGQGQRFVSEAVESRSQVVTVHGVFFIFSRQLLDVSVIVALIESLLSLYHYCKDGV